MTLYWNPILKKNILLVLYKYLLKKFFLSVYDFIVFYSHTFFSWKTLYEECDKEI